MTATSAGLWPTPWFRRCTSSMRSNGCAAVGRARRARQVQLISRGAPITMAAETSPRSIENSGPIAVVAMSNQHLRVSDGDSPLMHRATTHLSVVVGCYNAARHLEKRMLELVAFLDGTNRDYEVLIVEDGSVDGSLPILRRLEDSRARDQRAAQSPQHGQGLLDPERNPELERPVHHLHRRRHGVFEAEPARGAGATRKRRSVRRRQSSLAAVGVRRQQRARAIRLSAPPRWHRIQYAGPSAVRSDVS